MMEELSSGIGWNTCPVCGRLFYVSSGEWVYKRNVVIDGMYKTLYFHTWSCFNRFKEQHDEYLRQQRTDAAVKAAKTRKANVRRRIEGKHCEDCDLCVTDKYGFHDCLYFGWSVALNKNACRNFKAKEENNDEHQDD